MEFHDDELAEIARTGVEPPSRIDVARPILDGIDAWLPAGSAGRRRYAPPRLPDRDLVEVDGLHGRCPRVG